MADRRSGSAMGIVTRVRCDEPSSAPLQSGPVSARNYLVAVLTALAVPILPGPALRETRTAHGIFCRRHQSGSDATARGGSWDIIARSRNRLASKDMSTGPRRCEGRSTTTQLKTVT
jgi:hypothetical protein